MTTGVQPGIVEPRAVPAWNGRARVVGLAHEEIGLKRSGRSRLPVGPGGHDFGAAVGVFEVELTLEAGVFAVMVALFAEADVAAVPAIGQDRAQGVVPRMNPVRSHQGPVVDPSGVVGPAGVEIIVADALAVEVEVIKPQRGGVDCGLLDGLFSPETQREGRTARAERAWKIPVLYLRKQRRICRLTGFVISRSTLPSSRRAQAAPWTRRPENSRPTACRPCPRP